MLGDVRPGVAATHCKASLYIIDGDHDINHKKVAREASLDIPLTRSTSFICNIKLHHTINQVPDDVPEECSKMVTD